LTLRTITGAVTTSFQYDECGRLITSTDARRGDTEFIYFANSAVQSAMIDPADLAANRITEAYQYNSGGRRIATVDALGRTRRNEYDFRGRVVKEWGSAAYPVERVYCSCGKIAELKTYRAGTGWSGVSWPSGTAGTFDKTTWTYGPTTGLLMAKTDANNAAVTYGYDSAGRMTTRTWARGVVTNYGYDAATGELLSTTYSDATPAVTHTFNRLGRLTTVIDGTGSRTYAYTAHGQLATESFNVTGYGSATSLFAYDNSLRRVSATVADFNVVYHYEDLGRLSFVHSYSSGWSVLGNYRFNYLADSNLLSSVSNGTGYGIGTPLQVFTWSPHRNDLVSLSNEGMDPGSTNSLRFNYVRDALSRITQETRILDGQSTQPWASRTFAYNDRSELSAVTGEAESYAYDAQGNRQTGNGVNYQANALNQYATVGGVAWTYDADGNPLSDGQRTMVYDAENRLVQITKAGNVFTFRYDFRHRLVKQTGAWLTLWDSGSTAQVTSWRFHDGDKVVRRFDQSSLGTQVAEYMWGLDLSGRVEGGDGTGGLLAVMTSDAGYHRPLHDGRGNVWGYPSGTQSNSWLATGFLNRLSAFGELTHISGAPSNVPYAMLNIGQGTKEFLAEMGLYNYGRRFYDPRNGRFVGRDPIEEEGGLNLYGFVRNNPINQWDFLGMSPPGNGYGNWGNGIYGPGYYNDASDMVDDDWILIDGDPDSSFWFYKNRHDPAMERPYEGGGGGAPNKTEEKKIPCSDLRKKLLGKVLPESHGATGFLSGMGSYFKGNYRGMSQMWRLLPNAYNSNVFTIGDFTDRDIYKAHQLYQELGTRLITDTEYAGHAAEVLGVFASQNGGRLAGRVATGFAVTAGIRYGLQGQTWLGSVFAMNALKGDVVHLIEQGVDPLLALTAGVVGISGDGIEGEISFGGEDGLKRLEQMIWDDKFIQKVSGVPCEEGK